ncbi:unnamed protein product [Lampetra planeri]
MAEARDALPGIGEHADGGGVRETWLRCRETGIGWLVGRRHERVGRRHEREEMERGRCVWDVITLEEF